jgi:hypothetical protein
MKQLHKTILLDSAVFIEEKQWQIGCGKKVKNSSGKTTSSLPAPPLFLSRTALTLAMLFL